MYKDLRATCDRFAFGFRATGSRSGSWEDPWVRAAGTDWLPKLAGGGRFDWFMVAITNPGRET